MTQELKKKTVEQETSEVLEAKTPELKMPEIKVPEAEYFDGLSVTSDDLISLSSSSLSILQEHLFEPEYQGEKPVKAKGYDGYVRGKNVFSPGNSHDKISEYSESLTSHESGSQDLGLDQEEIGKKKEIKSV